MKKYAIAASFLLFNNEVISWIAVTVIAGMALVTFLKEMERSGFFK